MEVFLIMGAPGAGKTTYISEKLNGYFVISCDNIREAKYGCIRSFEIRQKVLQDILLLIEFCITLKINFVIDTTYFNDIENRQKLVELGFSKYINVIIIDTSLDKCIANNQKRKKTRVINERMVRMLHERMSAPTIFEKFQSLKRIAS
ncbi:ATP-binding protein [Alteromonas sp. a30]|uniref:ATP-binding protein n=1 Tax=Alteromonas sp. a30 TaxID=2730917 RepID=UPI00228261FF|nr:ATP-binding protein [Alteromonas sp. a30]MCY7295189.1 ATP-binding protein [Alteromonas sp. a30]